MASSYSTLLRLDLPADGDTSWSTALRTDIGTLLERAIAGWLSIAMSDANTTLTTNNGADDQARYAMLKFTGSLTANRNIVVPTSGKIYYIHNATTGGFSLVVKTTAGSGITVPAGFKALLYCDGTNVVEAHDWISALTIAGALSAGATTITGTLTPQGLVDASGASAGQIKFPASQNASADANTLDDYEEGTWTPGISFGGGTTGITYTTQTGRYTKIGRLVYVEAQIVLSAKGSSTGSALVTGLPFTVGINSTCGLVAVTGFSSLTAGIKGNFSTGATTISIRAPGTTGEPAATDTNFAATSNLVINGAYSV